MSDQKIYDRHNSLVGYIKESGHLMKYYDRYNKLLGWYDTESNKTYDRHNRLLSHGNTASGLFSS